MSNAVLSAVILNTVSINPVFIHFPIPRIKKGAVLFLAFLGQYVLQKYEIGHKPRFEAQAKPPTEYPRQKPGVPSHEVPNVTVVSYMH